MTKTVWGRAGGYHGLRRLALLELADFDFEQTLRDIHTELADLNKEAAELAAKIHETFEELEA